MLILRLEQAFRLGKCFGIPSVFSTTDTRTITYIGVHGGGGLAGHLSPGALAQEVAGADGRWSGAEVPSGRGSEFTGSVL